MCRLDSTRYTILLTLKSVVGHSHTKICLGGTSRIVDNDRLSRGLIVHYLYESA